MYQYASARAAHPSNARWRRLKAVSINQSIKQSISNKPLAQLTSGVQYKT